MAGNKGVDAKDSFQYPLEGYAEENKEEEYGIGQKKKCRTMQLFRCSSSDLI
jgi:hypothetical protein